MQKLAHKEKLIRDKETNDIMNVSGMPKKCNMNGRRINFGEKRK